MKAIAILKTDDGSYRGKIIFQQKRINLKIIFELSGFEPNQIHAVHIHEFGDITNGCHSLGGHFNPTKKLHFHSENGHAGDLFNNFLTDNKGTFNYTWETNKLSLNGNDISCILGRSIVIHKFPDDLGLRGQYIGNNFEIFKLYKDMNISELKMIYQKLGYHLGNNKKMTRESILEKLENESMTTGNASTRISYGIIGIANN